MKKTILLLCAFIISYNSLNAQKNIELDPKKYNIRINDYKGLTTVSVKKADLWGNRGRENPFFPKGNYHLKDKYNTYTFEVDGYNIVTNGTLVRADSSSSLTAEVKNSLIVKSEYLIHKGKISYIYDGQKQRSEETSYEGSQLVRKVFIEYKFPLEKSIVISQYFTDNGSYYELKRLIGAHEKIKSECFNKRGKTIDCKPVEDYFNKKSEEEEKERKKEERKQQIDKKDYRKKAYKFFPFAHNEKYGIVDEHKKVIIEPIYKDFRTFQDYEYLILTDNSGKELIINSITGKTEKELPISKTAKTSSASNTEDDEIVEIVDIVNPYEDAPITFDYPEKLGFIFEHEKVYYKDKENNNRTVQVYTGDEDEHSLKFLMYNNNLILIDTRFVKNGFLPIPDKYLK